MDTRGSDPVGQTFNNWHLAVLVPARNEEALLPRCLASVAQAQASLPAGVTSEVIVVSDASTDGTAKAARSLLGHAGTVLEIRHRCVGTARARAAEAVVERHGAAASTCWLANTDADCEVPPSWLLDHLRIAQEGYLAAAGIVDVNDFSEHQPGVESLFRSTYRLERDGSHPHVHGANLGIRLDAYLQVGGWRPLRTAEDHDLWTRLQAAGCLVLSDARLRVMTSGRRVGRAPVGFAAALAAHNSAVPA